MIVLTSLGSNLGHFVLIGSVIIALIAALRYFKQPYVIAYILAGVLLGEHGLSIITDEAFIANLGEIGLIFLLFFIGMEISLPSFVKNWKPAVIGTSLQVLGSIGLVGVIGLYFDWQINRVIILGFVICLSSSAVVIKLLQDHNETSSALGNHVISILITQDILIVPMLIIANYLGGESPSMQQIISQIVGGLLFILGIVWILRRQHITLPYSKELEGDHELQVFVAIVVCLGFSAVSAFFGLSPALGAFVGGLVIHAARSTEWFHDSLHAFRVIFVAIFFVSIGMLIDLEFVQAHWKSVASMLVVVYVANHFVNSLVLHYLLKDWRLSLYGGAFLAQIGELSFVIIASAMSTNIISDYAYQMTISVIALTLLVSPFWIGITKKILSLWKDDGR